MIPNGYDDKQRAVYRIQLWLRALSSAGMPIRTLIPDGIYDEKTGEAVRVFQGLSGLEATGRVDYATWIALRDNYRKIVEENALTKPIYPFEYLLNGGEVAEGDTFSLIYIIQAMIGELRTVYADLESQQYSGVFDAPTVRNVQLLQETWQTPHTGRVAKQTWHRLATAYNKILNKE